MKMTKATLKVPKMSDEKTWQAKEDMRTMMEAEKIKCDPMRMKMVNKVAASEMMAMKNVVRKVGKK